MITGSSTSGFQSFCPSSSACNNTNKRIEIDQNLEVGIHQRMKMETDNYDLASSCSCMEENKESIRTIFSYKASDTMLNETRLDTRNSSVGPFDARNPRTACLRIEENS